MRCTYEKKANKTILLTRKNELLIMILIFCLSVVGAILIHSARVNTGDMGLVTMGDQLIWLGIGTILMILCSRVNLKKMQKLTPLIAVLALVMLFLLKTPLGLNINGATRWMDLGWITIRPEELWILAFILSLARLTAYFHKHGNKHQLLGWAWGMAVVSVALISNLTNNMSYSVLLLGIAFLTTFVFAEMVLEHLVFLGISVTSVFLFISRVSKGNVENSFRLIRLKAWLNPYAYAEEQGYQAIKQLEAVKSGGLFGKGFGNGELQKSYRSAYTDSLFAMVCEEFGWIAATLLVIVILILLYRIYKIMKLAIAAKDSFCAVITLGVLVHVGLSAFVYIARNLNLLPNGSGVLPFVSYLGVSGMFLFCELGLVLAVSKKYQDSNAGRASALHHKAH